MNSTHTAIILSALGLCSSIASATPGDAGDAAPCSEDRRSTTIGDQSPIIMACHHSVVQIGLSAERLEGLVRKFAVPHDVLYRLIDRVLLEQGAVVKGLDAAVREALVRNEVERYADLNRRILTLDAAQARTEAAQELQQGQLDRVERRLSQQAMKLHTTALEQSATYRMIGWGVVGFGAAGIALGVLADILGAPSERALRTVCHSGACPAEEARAVNAHEALRNVGLVSYISGAVAAAAGVVVILMHREPDEPDFGSSIGLSFGPQGVGLQGSF
jgi:hypothetical protein